MTTSWYIQKRRVSIRTIREWYCRCLRITNYLPSIISSERVDVDPRKMEEVKNWPRPLNPIDIRSFLSLAGYHRRFVNCFSSIASLLTTLTKKSKKFEWSEACERSFQKFKYRLNSAPVLTLLEGTKGFMVYCDASRVGLG